MKTAIRLQNHSCANHPYWCIDVAANRKNIKGRFLQHVSYWSRCDALSRYKFSILQQINRVQLQGQALSEVELSYFMTVEADYRKTAKQKVKSTRLLFNLLAILQRNYEQVHPKHYLSIVQILTSDVYSQNRMVKVAHLLQKYAICCLKK